ncbi:MAG: hypothetical protein M3N13_03690 [Candidatus Eremiobacteraeota bacterium]|nr:hypothetical protein [Candidatus Eremiobacteraeota bacterium]
MAEAKGYVYTMYEGADPGVGWELNDPIFRPVPTLGACMPNLRRNLVVGDSIFVVSGRVVGLQRYIVGGFRVGEKIDALAAFARFPYYRLQPREGGNVSGNIIVQEDGTQNPLDAHTNFLNRVDDYIVGTDARVIEDPAAVEEARVETIPFLNDLFDRNGDRVYDIIGRQRRLSANQIDAMNDWLDRLVG